jgi:hypothetical protein
MSKISRRPTRANRTLYKYDRQFLGKVTDFIDEFDKKEQEAHLKAYIKGKRAYKWGTITEMDHMGRKTEKPRFIEVKQKITKIKRK